MPSPCRLFVAVAALLPLAQIRAADNAVDTTFAAGLTDTPAGWRRSFQAGGGTQDERIVGVRRTPDGGYVIAGAIAGGAAGRLIFLHKFRRNGTNDSTFGTDGRVVKDAFLSTVTDMTVDAQGRIVVVGATPGALGQADFGVVRFLANGADDTSFAGDGGTSVAFDYDAPHSRVNDTPGSVATLPDGSVVVAGMISDDDNGTPMTTVGVVKLKPDGARDTAFGSSGNGTALYCRAQCRNVVSVARVVHDATRNRLVIGGDYAEGASNTDWFIVTRDLVTSSSTTFTYAIDRGTAGGFPLDYMRGIAVQADGKILAAGYTTMSDLKVRGVVLRRQAASVAEDTTFGNVAGRGLFVTGTNDTIYGDVAVDGLGRVVVAGEYAAARKGAVLRLTAAGVPDTAFNGTSAETLYTARRSTPTIESYSTTFRRIALDGGQPLVAGESPDSATANTDYDLVLTRLSSDLVFADGF
ncbi:hypothetical protein [Tahibacter soli]|uniref:Delta-60 repeat protein n=1 Tax=Tahibacter soli TaxID=2983605 RepID=A0A9X4BIE6_9GAMM|nr:hypothetical protein [Tahibacter soli]MDC8011054.1 hypothetical protein [Tahibacter soli]